MRNVKVYSAPWCPFCNMTKKWLLDHHIPFEDINVQENKEASNYIFEKTGQTAIPVIEIDGKFIIGFDEKKLREALKIE